MTSNKTGLSRETSDQFYTKNSSVEFCIDHIDKYIKINQEDTIIEPSAGNGAFSDQLIKRYPKCIHLAYDIEPKKDYIITQNFLELNIEKNTGKIHVIGNPPFGRQSSLAKKFITKSSSFCDTISFILPKSFKKDSMIKSFPLNFHLIFSIDLAKNSFEVSGQSYDVPCIFQIWVKKDTKREVKKDEQPVYYQYVDKNDSDLSIRRVGIYTSKISKDTDKSIQSHYFIKLKEEIDIDKFIEEYNKIIFDLDNTVGPRSISKPELNREVNKLII